MGYLVATHEALRRQHDGLHPGGAHFVDGRGWSAECQACRGKSVSAAEPVGPCSGWRARERAAWLTCAQQGLSGGGLALSGLQHVAHVDFFHFFGGDS